MNAWLPVGLCRATGSSSTASGIFPRVSSFTIFSWNVSFSWGTFSMQEVILTCSRCSDFPVTLAASHPADAFLDLTANSIPGVIRLSFLVKMGSWTLSSNVSSISFFSLSIPSITHLSNVWKSVVFSLLAGTLSLIWPLIFQSTRTLSETKFHHPLLTSSTTMRSWSKSSNSLRKVSFYSFFSSWNRICSNKRITLIVTLMNSGTNI